MDKPAIRYTPLDCYGNKSLACSYHVHTPNNAINSGRIVASLVEWHLVGVVQPLAITMNEGVCLAVEVDPHHIERRLETGYCDEMASTLDETLHQIREAVNQVQPLSIGLIGNAAEVYHELVARGIVKTPIVIGRDHLDSGSVASPYRETEAMKDGSDVIADWPILNALLNTASGATWVSVHHGGEVGIGYSLHAGQVIVAGGSAEAAERLSRVLTNDPSTGVMRHVDAGYEEAIECTQDLWVKIPMLS